MQSQVTEASRNHASGSGRPRDAAADECIAVWLTIKSAHRPRRMPVFLNELAEPDFTLDACRESADRCATGECAYCAQWYCRFARAARDEFAPLRLLKRLTGAGFDVLRYDAAMHGEMPNEPNRNTQAPA